MHLRARALGMVLAMLTNEEESSKPRSPEVELAISLRSTPWHVLSRDSYLDFTNSLSSVTSRALPALLQRVKGAIPVPEFSAPRLNLPFGDLSCCRSPRPTKQRMISSFLLRRLPDICEWVHPTNITQSHGFWAAGGLAAITNEWNHITQEWEPSALAAIHQSPMHSSAALAQRT
ncbi:hypothetical protein EJ02DRAFT_100748 [Clathrospora elynae]|uniref:Uncharacterized protein n=1 Tax=Clathrospora elynae TaxID=706981 RepID=A0A6A5SX67_9PLEO|nr:hypothetical protein EJ02DRAFT_100748 [Clathrospora elynae]